MFSNHRYEVSSKDLIIPEKYYYYYYYCFWKKISAILSSVFIYACNMQKIAYYISKFKQFTYILFPKLIQLFNGKKCIIYYFTDRFSEFEFYIIISKLAHEIEIYIIKKMQWKNVFHTSVDLSLVYIYPKYPFHDKNQSSLIN